MSPSKMSNLLFLLGYFVVAKAVVCPANSTVVGGQCLACSPSCASCVGAVDDCTACPAGSFLFGVRCVPAAGCPAQTVAYNGVCAPCTSGCEFCSGTPSTCTSCVNGKNLLGTRCVDPASCPAGTVGMNRECAACVSPCTTCSGSVNLCTSCSAGFNLNGNLCLPAAAGCPPGQTASNGRCVKNDDCSRAIPLKCGSSISGDTSYAAFDGMWDCGISHSSPQLWYYVDAAPGQLVASTCNGASWDTQISVYSGTQCPALTCVDGVDDGCGSQTDLRVSLVRKNRYYIMVHGFQDQSGPFTLNVACTTPSPNPSRSPKPSPTSASPSLLPVVPSPASSPSPAPVNTQCPNAIPIQCGSTVYGDTTTAPWDGTWDCVVSHSSNQVWYYVDADVGQLQVSTCAGTTWDTQLSVYTGVSCASMLCVDGVDDGCGQQSLLNIPVTTGRYYIMVHGFGASSGAFALQVTCSTPSPLLSPSNLPSPSLGVSPLGMFVNEGPSMGTISSTPSSSTTNSAPYYALLALIPLVMAGVFMIMRVRAQRCTVDLVMDYQAGQASSSHELTEGYRTPFDASTEAQCGPNFTPPPTTCSKPIPVTPMEPLLP